jgi:hypothetical protein
MPRHRPAEERFWEKVDARGDCWEWTGAATPTGYGTFFPTRTAPTRAYRYAWESLIGPIPAGMTLDHLCGNRRCVNPDHLRVATQRENALRGHSPAARNARKTHCNHGHSLSADNLHMTPKGRRECVACRRRRGRETNARRRNERGAS